MRKGGSRGDIDEGRIEKRLSSLVLTLGVTEGLGQGPSKVQVICGMMSCH